MAQTVHLYLTANGTAIPGDSSQTSLGRENSIECLYFDERCLTNREATTSMATGRRQYEPLTIRKAIDKSSPLIVKALVENQAIDAIFKFFRPNPNGDGTTEQFYTISIKQGRIASVRTYLPFTLDPAVANQPAQEEVTMVFQSISWRYTNGGITFEDKWSVGR
jgi:type VI secretion system secreted protein Hcp